MKKKLLAIILCAILLTGVCATSFAADRGSVMWLILSRYAKANEESKRDFHEIKRLLRSAYLDFKKLSKPTFNFIKNNPDYKALPSKLAELEKHSDNDSVLKWTMLCTDIENKLIDLCLAIHLYLGQHSEHPDKINDSNIVEQIKGKRTTVMRIRVYLVEEILPHSPHKTTL